MLPKRQLRQGEEGGSELPNKRRHFASTLLKGLNYGRSVQESVSCLEPIIRKMVQESVEQAINRVQRSSYNQVEYHESRSLQLQFHSTLPEIMFTGNSLLSKERTPIKVVLYNSVSKQIETSSPLSSLKISLVVLDGDFEPDSHEDWTANQFDRKLMKTREGKRPLVAGETAVTLKDGVGFIGDLSFTDNSKWSRSGKFRLGAKASGDISIREAVSNAFRVKDHRGESYQKHYPPVLDDDVWRLEKIAKDGTSHKKLNDNGIVTVRDFLRLYTRDQSRLRDIIDVPSKAWDTIIGHATTCDSGKEEYMYKTARGMLFFNSIYKFVKVSFDGVTYHSAANLHSFQMRFLEELKQEAYNNLAAWIPVSDPSISGFPMLLGNVEAETFTNPNSGLIGLNFQEQDHAIEMNGIRSFVPLAYNSEVGQENYSYNLDETSHGFNPTFRNSFAIVDPLTAFSNGGHHAWSLEGNYMGPQLSTDDLQIHDFQVESSAWQGGNGLFIDPGNRGIGIISSDSSSPKTKWCKVLAVVKWRILARRNVAARKCKSFYSYM